MNDSFPPVIDGVANAVLNYAKIISAGLGECVVATPEYPGAVYDYPFPVIPYPSLDTTRLLGYRTGVPLDLGVMKRLTEERCDFIHSHCPVVSTLLARSLRARTNVPVVLTYHTKFDIDIANALRSKLLQETTIRLLVSNIETCDEVWVVSRGAGENLRGMGYTGEYRIMENGVDLPRGKAAPEVSAAAAAGFDLPEGVPLYLFVGRLMWYKGIRLILEGLAGLMAGGRDFRMVFIGAGSDQAEIVKTAGELGLGGKCIFTGPLRERELLRGWYSRADLLLFPSTFDTNGLVVREAAACALPALLVEGSCAAEGVRDGVNGILIREDAAALQSALEGLYDRREALAEIGRHAMEELYLSWEDSVRRACSRYEEILAQWPGRRRREPKTEMPGGRYSDIQEALEEISRRMKGRMKQLREAAARDVFPEDRRR